MLKSLNILIFILGISLIVIGYTHDIKDKCTPRIEYRYIPKNTYHNLLYNDDIHSGFLADMGNLTHQNFADFMNE